MTKSAEQTAIENELDAAMEKVLSKIRANANSDEALKFSQAALNLAHVRQLLNVQKQ